MFGIFKRKEQGGANEEGWGQPLRRKLSKDEAAKDAAQQKLVEEKNKERRDMYRFPGNERIFTDLEGRRLALRTEENAGPQANPHHPPLQIVVFWGTREIGHVQAEYLPGGAVRQTGARVEEGYQKRGIAEELLNELESIARRNNAGEVRCEGVEGNEWSREFLANAGYASEGGELVKKL
ncbi:MAG TPA: GNAT family N-acetyltransferase [Chloroflexia bacterium]|nr:GNAT family N-acetyltransferase [Chloroflexia bacterium]